jgi:hypothetical protein
MYGKRRDNVMKAQREAEMIWNGTLARGTGAVTVGSGAVETLPMTWASRIEQPDGKTSSIQPRDSARHIQIHVRNLWLPFDFFKGTGRRDP